MDAIFKTNVLRYPLFLLLVFDNWINGISVVWVFTSQMIENDLIM